MKEKSLTTVAALLIGLALLLAACAPAAPVATSEPQVPTPEVITNVVTATAPPRGGDTLNFRLALDPETLDSAKTTSGDAEGVFATYLLERLVYVDLKDGKTKPWLAESWEVSEDQKEITFKLREGVKFHDGTDFNAEAVKFNFDRIMDPATASPALGYIEPLKSVEVVDDYTVKFTFEEPYASFWTVMTYGYFGFNSPTAIEKFGDEYGRNPVGTGPFMFESWIPGSQITLVRNPNYQQFREDAINKGPALAEKVVLTVIPEEGTARAALETGEILMAQIRGDVVPSFLGDPRYQIEINKNGVAIHFIDFNYDKEPFNDPKFRRALGYAVDRASIVASSRNGYSWEALNLLAPGLQGYDPSVSEEFGTPYDPEKAKELLAEIGWTDTDGDGILDKDGVPAKWELRSYSGFAYNDRTMEVIQSNFKDIGIDLTLTTSDWGVFFPSLLEDDWDMAVMNWDWSDAGVLSVLWRSPGYREHLPPDPELDSVLDELEATVDPEARAPIVSEAQKLLLEKMIAVPIQSNWTVLVLQSNVRDFHYDWIGYMIPGDIWLEK